MFVNNPYWCPACGSRTLWAVYNIEQALDDDLEFTDDSFIRCNACGMVAQRREFAKGPVVPDMGEPDPYPFKVPNLLGRTLSRRQLSELSAVFSRLSDCAMLASMSKKFGQEMEKKINTHIKMIYLDLPEWARWKQ